MDTLVTTFDDRIGSTMKRGIPGLMVALLLIAGCASAKPARSMGQQASPYHPPDAQLIALAPTSSPTTVNLTTDGFFTAEGVKISFLRECAETTLKDGYDSFALSNYSMKTPRPRHKEARGDIIEMRGRTEDRSKNLYDARKVLADPKI